MEDDKYTIKSGHLKVGGGHSIYYQQWGNIKADPIFFLHGGPGGGLKDRHKVSFDPLKHQVVFHDQRGCGKSSPFGGLEDNNTDQLIEDINKIKAHLGIKRKIKLFGGSWGSCLALAYAIKYPKYVSRMLINGIYTGTKSENDYIQQGGLSTHFPESWQQYVEVVPEDMKNNTVAYYYKKMQDPNQDVADNFIRRWNINEGSAMSIDPDLPYVLMSNNEVDEKARSTAIIEAHYFINDCFMPDGHILSNVDKLLNIPIVMVQGRHGHVCPPTTAYKQSDAIGNNCQLHITPGSHAREGAFREVIKAYINVWL